jgi:L-seryl-tRNA(Ser) seleniumtransferase
MIRVSILSEPYEKLGLKRTINAATSLTTLGGSMPDPRIFKAMEDASKGFILIPELQKASGNRIAELLGVEAAHPAAGAVNALMLAVAACMFKGTELEEYDPVGLKPWTEIIQQLPLHTENMKNEFIILGDSRSEYDHAIECAGGKRVQAGSKEGVTAQDLKDACTEKTAALYCTFTPSAKMPIKEFCDVAKELGVPAIVDAAPNLTHQEMPAYILGQGADLVIFSGGKQLGCINNTGLLLGRSDLIKLAHLNSYPFDGVGRAAKMSRETIMGLLRAIEIFTEEDRNEFYGALRVKTEKFSRRLNEIKGIKSGTFDEPCMVEGAVPPSYAWVEVEPGNVSLRNLYEGLLTGSPPIKTIYEPYFLTTEAANRISIKVEYFLPGDDEIVLKRINEIMAS